MALARLIRMTALALCVAAPSAAATAEEYAAERAAMVRTLESYRAEMSREMGRDALDPRVLEVMGEVPRHAFVPEDLRARAYDNRPLPIGNGQTISQPLIVALMTSVLAPRPGDTVLEIGTGSGYQAAVLSPLVDKLHTIEIVPALARTAERRLARLGYANVEVRTGDGWRGWPEAAPFDRIIVTAAPERVPEQLVAQLAPGGRMVLPLGGPGGLQYLTLIEKDEAGAIREHRLIPVRFVPMTGGR